MDERGGLREGRIMDEKGALLEQPIMDNPGFWEAEVLALDPEVRESLCKSAWCPFAINDVSRSSSR